HRDGGGACGWRIRFARRFGAASVVAGGSDRCVRSVVHRGALLGCALCRRPFGREVDQPRDAIGATSLIVAASAIPGIEFMDIDESLNCIGSDPEICLAAGYVGEYDHLAELFEPMISGIREAGLDPPERLSQDVTDPTPGSVTLPFGVVVA